MKIHLQYGRDGLDVEILSSNVTELTPRHVVGLADEEAEFQRVVRHPIGAQPLREVVRSGDRVAVVIPDITRALPSDRLLPWVFEELSHVPRENFTIVVGTGSHRANTDAELAGMVGREIVSSYRIVNHQANNLETLALAGKTNEGREVFFNKQFVEADRRIVMGFIEPHFFAGFSGGYKGIFPAIADLASIMHYHRATVIADPRSTWGVLEKNPTQEQVRANGALLPVDFCVNVTLNRHRQITRFFCGEVLAAHRAGCAFVKETSMIPCARPFPIVVTSNSGYPLDQNLYQAVKGMSAAAQIIAEGGLILAAARCNDGFPSHGNFRKLLFENDSPRAILDLVMQPNFSMADQWQAQTLALILRRARVGLFSELTPPEVRRAHLEPVVNISERIEVELKRIGSEVPIAVLPEGPMTIPYLS